MRWITRGVFLLALLAVMDVTTATFATMSACSTSCPVAANNTDYKCSKPITTPSETLCSSLNGYFTLVFQTLEQERLPKACFVNATDIFCDVVFGAQDLLENYNDCEYDESNALPLQFCHTDCVSQLNRLKQCALAANSSYDASALDNLFACSNQSLREFNCMTSAGFYVLSTPEEPVPTATITFLSISLGGLVVAIGAIVCYKKYCRRSSKHDFSMDEFSRRNRELSDDLSLSDHDSDQPVFRDTPFDDPENPDM